MSPTDDRGRRPARGIALAGAVLALMVAAPSSPARPDCGPAGPPSATSAWRARVPALTPLRPTQRASPDRSPAMADTAWLMVLGRARAPDGTCLVEVRLDRRPNTAHAWVAAARVIVHRTGWRIEVSRASRRVTLRHDGRVVRRWSAVVGKPDTRTPTGLFAIAATYRSPAQSFEGTWILTLTAHSQALLTFDGGDGRVALHGRGGASLADPLGSARSHGCVRLDNAAIGGLVRLVGRDRLPGVPVVIT